MEQRIIDHLQFIYEKTKWPFFDYALVYSILDDVSDNEIKQIISNLIDQNKIKIAPGIHGMIIEYLP